MMVTLEEAGRGSEPRDTVSYLHKFPSDQDVEKSLLWAILGVGSGGEGWGSIFSGF